MNNRELLIKENIYESLIKKCISDLNKLEYSPFMPYLHACIQAVNVSFGKTMLFTISDSIEFKNRYNFIANNFQGMAKNFLLSRCLFTALEGKIPLPRQYIQRYESDCTDKIYTGIINRKQYSNTALPDLTGMNYIMTTKGKVLNCDSLIGAYKGKLILIDFWASWCAPCRKEFPYSANLRKVYKGKNIVFVYVSIDKNKNDWERAVSEEDLNTNSNSFLLIEAEKSRFFKEYNISTIPRYLLIGIDGKPISSDAPRPSDPKLSKLIDKHM